MTTRELVIETQLQVKRLAAHRRDALNESQIVWRLNTAQDRLVRDAIEPDPNNPNKFLINQASNSLIQPLIKTNVPLTTHFENSKRGFGFLPSDFGYLVNDRSLVLEDCNKTAFSSPTVDINYFLTLISFADSPNNTAPYYSSIGITATSQGNSSTTTYSTQGLSSKKEKFELIGFIMDKLTEFGKTLDKPLAVYWEKFDNIYSPNTFICIAEPGNPSISLVLDGAVCGSSTRTLSKKKIKRYAEGNEAVNRGYKGDSLYDAMFYNYYEQPTPDSPITQLADNKLYFYCSKRFLVSELVVDYIRKPRRISLYLDSTSELDSNVHEKICSLAAEAILGNVEAANYPLKVQENITRL